MLNLLWSLVEATSQQLIEAEKYNVGQAASVMIGRVRGEIWIISACVVKAFVFLFCDIRSLIFKHFVWATCTPCPMQILGFKHVHVHTGSL